jgi:cytoskeletal protein CcmA (bactofilin family)
MMKRHKILTFLTLLAIVLFSASPAYAQGPDTDEGKVIFGSNYTLESDDTFNGDLVVFGGNVTVEEDAELNGNIVVFGGTITSNGLVNGDVVIMGGQVKLEEHAVVEGDLVTIGGQVEQADGAQVNGDVINNVPPEIEIPSGGGRVPPEIDLPNVPQPNFDFNFNPFMQFFQVFSWAFAIAAFAMLLMLFWQAPLERAGTTIVSQPLMSGAIGLVSVLVGILFALTIVPPIIVAFAWLFGIVAMGREVGERFATAINQRWTPVVTAGSGTFLLMVVGGAIGMIPCIGGLIVFLLGLLGIGGAISTWFNLQPALRPTLPAYTPPNDTGEVPPVS